MESRAVLSKTPLVRPILRKSPPTVPSAPSPSLASPPISTIHRDSGRAGRACMLSGCRVSCGSHTWAKCTITWQSDCSIIAISALVAEILFKNT